MQASMLRMDNRYDPHFEMTGDGVVVPDGPGYLEV